MWSALRNGSEHVNSLGRNGKPAQGDGPPLKKHRAASVVPSRSPEPYVIIMCRIQAYFRRRLGVLGDW